MLARLKFAIAGAVAVLTATVAVAAAAEIKPPKWDIAEVCTADELHTGPCPRVESDSRRGLLDRWTALPANVRTACLKDVDVEGQRSYRRLASCIDELALKAFDEQRANGSQSH